MYVLITLAIYIVTLVVISGIGRLIWNSTSFFVAFWAGFGLLLSFLPLWHLVMPVDHVTLVLVVMCGGLGWIVRRSVYRWRISVIRLLGFLLLTIGLTARAIEPLPTYDDGLYHFQTIQWFQMYPAVMGLANLHGRLGFNSSFYLYATLFETLPGGAIRYANPILSLAFVGYVFSLRSKAYSIGVWLLLPCLLLGSTVASLSNDFPAMVAGFVVLLGVLTHIQGETENPIPMAMLTVGLVTIKLSMLVFGVLSFALLAYCSRNRAIVLLATGFIASLFWIFHGVVLSGYLIYPLLQFPIPVDWSVTRDQAMNEALSIASWARSPGLRPSEVLENWRWLMPWLANAGRAPAFMLPILLWIPSLYVIIRSRPLWTRWLWVLLPCMASLIYWFFSAPDLRFGVFNLWAIAAILLVYAVQRYASLFRLVYSTSLLIVSLLSVEIIFRPSLNYSADIKLAQLSSNYQINVPVEGDQCWDAPLPCTPYPKLLELRGNSLRDGFRVLTDSIGTIP